MGFASLLRPRQYYKNLVIFTALFFTQQLFDLQALALTAAGFAALCLVSSANYIINDILDRKKDSRHPMKRTRPIASGQVKVWQGLVLAGALLGIAALISAMLPMAFMAAVAGLFILSSLYSLLLKREPFLDTIVIGILFVLRAVSGALILDVEISPWLVMCAFFLAMLLALGKRRAELQFGNALKAYSKGLLDRLMAATMAMLAISYGFYTFIRSEHNLIITLPIAVYGLNRFYWLASSDSPLAMQAELLLADWRMLLTLFLWAGVLFAEMYL